jgi:hypothetical protein
VLPREEAKESIRNVFPLFGLRLRQHRQFIALVLFLKEDFYEGINNSCYNCRIINFIKIAILEN